VKLNGQPATWTFAGKKLTVHSLNTLVVGSGAAARNAALQQSRRGVHDVAIVTEKWNAGTSYNAGSDKQTYYKVALSGRTDSPRQLADDLWAGDCMHGDIALCEALGSARAFFNLVELGVPFPHDRHGGYLGYRTDNDQRGRATSAGPLTSRLMCERLGAALERAGVRVFDRHQVVALLTRPLADDRSAVCGAIALDQEHCSDVDYGLVVFNARNVILATGGPGGMYRDSVYPQSQLGSTGMALRAGAVAHNLTESQFGIASVGFRWNLSGSYQQVIPRYVSTDAGGGDEREFLNAHFPDMETLATAIFRKGYEWPFDCERVADYGSSLIDLLVYREVEAGRRVFLDFTRDPQGGEGLEPFRLESLGGEARDYLERSGALAATPVARLAAMNEPAIAIFRDNGIDLAQDRLEIAVCAQHNNGGLRANLWWESNLAHLFPVGEVCGTHGVRRPGGAALNSGQVGGIRAALYISKNYAEGPLRVSDFAAAAEPQVEACLAFCKQACSEAERATPLTPARVIGEIQARMSRSAAHVREPSAVSEAARAARGLLDRLPRDLKVSRVESLPVAFRAADLCLTHWVYLEAIRAYLEAGGRSRGSAVVLDREGELPCPSLDDAWRFKRNEPGASIDREVLEVWMDAQGEVESRWVPVRPVPSDEGWFEQVWRDYREGRVIE
jgi:succinate dehydrogenase/fumarate reductase flavoprotein subunit